MNDHLPNFLICGTMKGGTTSLYHYLKDHPEIYFPRIKEIHYFNSNYHKGIEWYKRFFKGVTSKHKAIGEVTPAYMYFEYVPERIHEVLPDVKLIFILRDPIKRAYSHYWHSVRRGTEFLPFEEAIKIEDERISKGRPYKGWYSYLDRGKYIEQINRFLKYFSKDQMLILITEEVNQNLRENMIKIFKFINVDHNFYNPDWENKRYNPGMSPRSLTLQLTLNKIGAQVNKIGKGYRKLLYKIRKNRITRRIFFVSGYPKMSYETMIKLDKYFREYNRRLETFLGRKLISWSIKC